MNFEFTRSQRKVFQAIYSTDELREGKLFSVKDFFNLTNFPYSVTHTQRMFRELIKIGFLNVTKESPKEYWLTELGKQDCQVMYTAIEKTRELNGYNQLNQTRNQTA